MAEMVRRRGGPGDTEPALRPLPFAVQRAQRSPAPSSLYVRRATQPGVRLRGNSARSCWLWAKPRRATQGEGPFYARQRKGS